MVGVDFEIGTSALRFWLAAGSVALLVAAGLLVLAQRQARVSTFVAWSGVGVLGIILATSLAWVFLNYSRERDRDADRQALEMRAEQLIGIALAPGSPLSCLDALAGESVEAACEKALFATPATVAAAGSYVAAELRLLSDMVAYVDRGGLDIDNALLPLRRSLEADRFGILAHVLAVRDGCTEQDCKALALLREPSHVRANLSDAPFERYLEQYQAAWTQPVGGPVAEAPQAEPNATAQLVPPGQRKVLVNIDFPTAASIPPISIMNPDPAGRSAPPAAAAAANSNVPASAEAASKRLRKQAANPPGQAAAPASPAQATAQTQEDPVWLPAPVAPPPQPGTQPPPATAAPQTAATSAAPAPTLASGPVQLNPFASQK
jgi:hypothetical protein